MAKEKIVHRNNIICLDFETGGLNARKNPITQVALQSFKIDTLEEISRYSTFVKGYDNLIYEEAALKYTGVTMKDINNGIDVAQTVKILCDEFQKANTGGHTKKPILLGHNIMFDISFMQYIFKKCKVDLSKYLDCKEDGYGNQVPAYYDTMWLSRMKWAGEESMTKFTLTACCERAGIDIFDAHDAFNDVTATKALFIYLTNHLRTGSDSSQESQAARFRTTFQF